VKAVLFISLTLAACTSRPPLPSFGVVPYFQLTSQTGQTFDSRVLDGKVWVANFIFTSCPGPCPRMSSQMRDLRAAVPQLVSFTIDPARDTPAVLAAYAHRYEADPQRWHFLTGAQSELQLLARNVFKVGDVDGALEHSTRFILVDGKRRIRGFYDSSDRDKIRQLIADIQHVE
jgi:protein SCO1/2